MYYDTPPLNKNGKPLCQICQCAYDRLTLHVNKRHGLTAIEYKKKFNYNPHKGIQSASLRSKMSRNTRNNYNKVIMPNLIIAGQKTRFKEGNTFTDKVLVSKITKARMAAIKASKIETRSQIISGLTRILNPKKKSRHSDSR